jgi:hypothetical protein
MTLHTPAHQHHAESITRVVEQAPGKPANFGQSLAQLLSSPTSESIAAFYGDIKDLTQWPQSPSPMVHAIHHGQ